MQADCRPPGMQLVNEMWVRFLLHVRARPVSAPSPICDNCIPGGGNPPASECFDSNTGYTGNHSWSFQTGLAVAAGAAIMLLLSSIGGLIWLNNQGPVLYRSEEKDLFRDT